MLKSIRIMIEFDSFGLSELEGLYPDIEFKADTAITESNFFVKATGTMAMLTLLMFSEFTDLERENFIRHIVN